MNSTETKEQLGPVDLGLDPVWLHWRRVGDPVALCGSYTRKASSEAEAANGVPCPDCERLYRKIR